MCVCVFVFARAQFVCAPATRRGTFILLRAYKYIGCDLLLLFFYSFCLSVCVHANASECCCYFLLLFRSSFAFVLCECVYCLLLCRTFTCLLTTNAQLNFCLIWTVHFTERYDLFITMIIGFFVRLLSIYCFIEHPKIWLHLFRHLLGFSFWSGQHTQIYTYHWLFVGFFAGFSIVHTVFFSFVSMRARAHANVTQK